MNYGLLENKIQDIRDYVLGASKMPFISYREDGDWSNALPKYENQTTENGQETSGCGVWGTQNQMEMFEKGVYGVEPNYSERYTYLLSGVRPAYGIDPNLVYETIRHQGVVDEKELPMKDTLPQYLDKTDITGSLLAKGQNWLYKNELQHEWLWKTNARPSEWRQVLRDALTTSPVAVSVTAWRQENGVYVSGQGGNNHWCVLYKIDDAGLMYVFDSYNHSTKILHPEHYIRRAKRIWINKKDKRGSEITLAIIQKFLNKLLMKPSLLDVCEAHIGTDASPSDLAPDELGCAETVSTLLRKVYPNVPIITGTWTLWDWLNKPQNGFQRVFEPSPGTIIISPTIPGKPFPGHAGIFLEDGVIASNDSRTGKFIKNYTLGTWNTRYVFKGNYPVYHYKHN